MAQWDADDYRQHSSAQHSWAREVIAKLVLRGDERVLDIGSGDGKVTAELAAHVPHGSVLGVDSSPDMVRFAREAFPLAQHPRLRFEAMDARDLRFDAEFDVVFSNATLHWIVDHRPVLTGIARALVPRGRLLAQMAGRGNAAAVIEVMHALIEEPEWRGHFAGFTFPYGFHDANTYRACLAGARLAPLRVELFAKDMVQAGPAGLAGWIRTTWLPYLERVPQERRADLVAAVVERYIARHPCDPQGMVHVGMARLEVEAVRPE